MSNDPIRLNKFLASGGVGSRRHCDALVKDGEVTVNGEICLNPGIRITADDEVRHGRKIISPKQTLLILFNKPRGLVCTKDDEFNRNTIYNSLPHKLGHLNHVGRLDQDSEGLLLLTNDGDLANRISHPRHKTEKEYIVTISSSFDPEVLDKLLAGIYVPVLGKLKAKAVRRLSPRRLSMVLETGVKRQIREMFKALHLRVSKLVRVRIGSLTDPTLPPGRHRPLEAEEIELLMVNPAVSTKRRPTRSTTTDPGPARKKTARKSAPRNAKSSRSSGGGRKSSPKQSGSRKGPARKSGKSHPGKRPGGRRKR